MAAARTGEVTRASPLSSLRHRDFAIFWVAALISNSGTWMQTITVPFVLFELTDSNTWVGAGAVFAFVPGLLVGPLAGTLADRFDRKRIIFWTQFAAMVVALLMWGLWVADAATPWRLAGLLVVSGIVGGLNIAAWQSFVPLLVPRESLLNAVRLNSMQFTAARAFGPAAAGLVLRSFGPGGAFLGNAVSYLLVLIALVMIHPRGQHIAAGAKRFREEFRLGLAYVRQRPAMVHAILTIVVMATLGGSVVQLAAGFNEEEFGASDSRYGFLIASFGFGAITGAVLLLVIADRVRRSRMALTGVGMEATGVVLLSLAPTYAWGVAAMVLMGLAWVMCGVSLNTAIQSQVVDEFRGRVLSLYLMGLQLGTPLGALVLGRLGDHSGLRPVVRTSGVILAAYLVFAIVVLGGMRGLDPDSDPVGLASYTPAP